MRVRDSPDPTPTMTNKALEVRAAHRGRSQRFAGPRRKRGQRRRDPRRAARRSVERACRTGTGAAWPRRAPVRDCRAELRMDDCSVAPAAQSASPPSSTALRRRRAAGTLRCRAPRRGCPSCHPDRQEQDLDRLGAWHITHTFDRVERVGRVRVAKHDRRSLRAHAAEQQAERNVNDQIAARAQARRQSLRFGGSVAHEDERLAGSAPAISAGRGFEHHAHPVYARRLGSRYADPRPGSVFLSGGGGLEATRSAIRSPSKGQNARRRPRSCERDHEPLAMGQAEHGSATIHTSCKSALPIRNRRRGRPRVEPRGPARVLREPCVRVAANTRILGISSLYQTVPVGPQQPLF